MDNKEKDSDKTRLAVIANTLGFMQADIASIKSDMREVKNAYMPISIFNDFKIDYAKHLVAAESTFATKEEIDGLKRIAWLIGSAAIIAITAAFFKLIFIK